MHTTLSEILAINHLHSREKNICMQQEKQTFMFIYVLDSQIYLGLRSNCLFFPEYCFKDFICFQEPILFATECPQFLIHFNILTAQLHFLLPYLDSKVVRRRVMEFILGLQSVSPPSNMRNHCPSTDHHYDILVLSKFSMNSCLCY